MMLIINKLLRTPTKHFAVIHGFSDFNRFYRQFFLNTLWDKSWHFVGVSEPVSSYLKRILKRPPSNVTTINNCIDVEAVCKSHYTKQISREKLGLQEDVFIFGSIGRLIPLKGHLHLINAFKIVLETKPNCHLIIIGGGRSQSELENFISTHNLRANITITGQLNNASKYLKALDTFILPSLKEGFGIVLLEAMAAKLPIIASRTGGIPNVLGNLGHLKDLNYYPQNLSEEMLHQVNLSPNKRKEEGTALYKRLLDKFDKKNFQKQWTDLLKKQPEIKNI